MIFSKIDTVLFQVTTLVRVLEGIFVILIHMKPTNVATLKRVYAMIFAKVYPLNIATAEKNDHTKDEVVEIIHRLTRYITSKLNSQIKKEVNFETFFKEASKLNPSRKLITGMVCGGRVEKSKDPVMGEMRSLDKLVDKLAKGQPMEKILWKK